MWDLRWVLLGLGGLVLLGVYLWSRGVFSRRLLPSLPRRAQRTEPTLAEMPDALLDESTQNTPLVEVASAQPKAGSAPERIVALRLIPRDGETSGERAVHVLSEAGLEHGRYAIFHRTVGADREAFSVASLTEPGSFDLDNLAGTSVAGLSFFMVLPGNSDPVARFDSMVETARALSVELAADLFDERGSSWSSQRERYLREELIGYRHQIDRR